MSARASVCLYLVHVRCHFFFCRFLVILMCVLIIVVIFSILALCSSVRSLQGGVGMGDFFIGFTADVAHFNFRIPGVGGTSIISMTLRIFIAGKAINPLSSMLAMTTSILDKLDNRCIASIDYIEN